MPFPGSIPFFMADSTFRFYRSISSGDVVFHCSLCDVGRRTLMADLDVVGSA